ncbi:unnamed protein product [Cuscuta epithymum]|uniref:Uncharacterized protein n=1 Tax=Cuscuta epithymum TaxID=186058 RepID=A0AAV0D895_9ASTE|nr:unnamed protein product [Cuscuta epithymum]
MLRTEASFEIYNTDEALPGESKNEELIAKEVMSSGEFSFRKIDEIDGEGESEQEESVEEKFKDMSFAGDGDEEEIEKYYKMKLKENPSNPLFLRKYAQLLQSKGNMSEAEEQYFLATLADPKDGDTLAHYAQLVWELYHDKDRAHWYFKRALLAASNDSYVLGACASFLWEIDGSDDEPKEDSLREDGYSSSAIATEPSEGAMILAYANFIWKLHHDKDKASLYFERAIQASPEDSIVLGEYASFLWQIEED